jgi:chorismate dehydratase
MGHAGGYGRRGPHPLTPLAPNYASIMDPVRIACVRYLNTAPLVEGLDKMEGVTLIPTVPSRIADAVASGEADVGLVSIVDAVLCPVPLALLPVGMIGCDGPTHTVRLFSAAPISEIRRLHADTDSHTSVILARVLLKHLHGISPEVVPFDARERVEHPAKSAPIVPARSLDEAWPESVLLIGDKVVTDHPPEGRYPHQLDLGEAWKALTGLPFVYAIWMCRQGELGNPRLALAAQVLDRQRRHNATRLDWIVAKRAPEARWPIDVASRYVRELLHYNVGEREREGVAKFLALAHEQGLVPMPGLVWADA